jgi:hypothetical protein
MNRACRIFILLLVLVLAVLPVASFAGEERPDEEVLREIKEVLWPRAYATQDVDLLDSILAEEFQMVDAEGNWSTKAAELEWIRANAPSYDSLEYNITRLDIFENGTAIVAGTGVVSGSAEEGPYVLEYQSTNVLIKRDGVWQAVASHVSGTKDKD